MSRTLYWLTASSHRAGLASSSEGGMRMDWCPEYTLQGETRVSAGERRGRSQQLCPQELSSLTWKQGHENILKSTK